MSPRSMTPMWSERVFVVNAVDRIGMTSQVLALFTEREGADAFCAAQPRMYYRRVGLADNRSARERYLHRQLAGDPEFDPQREGTQSMQLREAFNAEKALGWRPCVVGREYPAGTYELRGLDIFVCDTPWNPPIATWPPSNPEVVRNAITLEEPGRQIDPVADGEDIRRPGITSAKFWNSPIEPIVAELPPIDDRRLCRDCGQSIARWDELCMLCAAAYHL